MVTHILQAYDADIKTRTEGLEHSNRTGYKVNVHEITPGVVYRDASVTVKPFNAYHGSPQNTFGYRFETSGRVIVISGDATPKSDVLQNCQGCDVLIHEVYTQASFDKASPEWKQYREAFHTSTRQLAEIANKTNPGLLVLYHRANPGSDRLNSARSSEARVRRIFFSLTKDSHGCRQAGSNHASGAKFRSAGDLENLGQLTAASCHSGPQVDSRPDP